MNINEQLNNSQKEYGVNQGGFFKFQNGDNRIRILTAGQVIATHFFGAGQKPSVCYGAEKGCPYHGDKAMKDDKGNDKKPSLKYTCYIIDKSNKNDEIQIADLPYSVIKQVGDYQANIDYSFDSFPMPYDVTVKYNKESKSPNEMYKVIASPKREEVSQDILTKLISRMRKLSPEQFVQNKKENQIKNHTERGLINKESRKEWAERMNTEAKSSGEPVIDYPQDDINPDDIGF